MTQIDEDKVLTRTLADTSGVLLVFLKNRLRALAEAQPDLQPGDEQIQQLLEQAVAHGAPELAEAASKMLLQGPFSQKVGESPDVVELSSMLWAKGVGEGSLEWAGEQWKVFYFGDTLPIPPELSEKLTGDPEPGHTAGLEPRQCLLLHVAAGIQRLRSGRLPALQKVHALAAQLRAEMLDQALEASECLGPAPEYVSQAESDLRVFLHDLTHRGHDKDYRCLAACPPVALDLYALNILRLDAYQRRSVETVCGIEHAGGLQQQVWRLVHKGHMRLLMLRSLAESIRAPGRSSLAAGRRTSMRRAGQKLTSLARRLRPAHGVPNLMLLLTCARARGVWPCQRGGGHLAQGWGRQAREPGASGAQGPPTGGLEG
jgi:hypothetical protein